MTTWKDVVWDVYLQVVTPAILVRVLLALLSYPYFHLTFYINLFVSFFCVITNQRRSPSRSLWMFWECLVVMHASQAKPVGKERWNIMWVWLSIPILLDYVTPQSIKIDFTATVQNIYKDIWFSKLTSINLVTPIKSLFCPQMYYCNIHKNSCAISIQ